MKMKNKLLAGLLIFLFGCSGNTNDYRDTNPKEDHVIGIMVVKEGEDLKTDDEGRYFIHSEDNGSYGSISINKALIAYDPDEEGECAVCGHPSFIGEDTENIVKDNMIQKDLYPVWAVSKDSEIKELGIWLVHMDEDKKLYAADTHDVLKIDEEGKEYRFDYQYDVDDKAYSYSISIHPRLVSYDVNPDDSLIIIQYDQKGNSIVSDTYGAGLSSNEIITEKLEDETVKAVIRGTIRKHESNEWMKEITTEESIHFIQCYEDLDGFIQLQEWNILFRNDWDL